MATNRDFQSMLNEFLPMELMKAEMMKRDYLLQSAEMDDTWKGGNLVVPFEGQNASSVEFGQLAADTDISKYKYVRGGISVQPEVWGTMRFEHRDLMEHNGKIPESTFLKILPGQIDDFLTNLKMVVSVNMLNGAAFATLTVDGTAGGVIEVDRIDRFSIDQKLYLYDGNTAAAAFYVIAIDVNGGTLKNGSVTLSSSRGGSATSVAAYTVAQSAVCYHPGAQSSSFTSLKSQLLSATNGGTSTIFGQTKTAYPYLQAVQIDGSAVSATNILSKIFDGYTRRQILGKGGSAPEVLMSLKHFGSCLKVIELQKGAFNIVPGSRKVSQYGYDTIEIGSVSGQTLKLVGIQELDDTAILFLDWSTITVYSNGMFKRRTAPDGKQYFEVRSTAGYAYILDHCFFGDVVCKAPWKNAIMYSIPAY
jgi:hypothetical protein